MKVLVTGSSGFLGAHLVRHLQTHSGYEVLTLDRFSGAEGVASPHLLLGDANYENVAELLSSIEFDAVVHGAAMSSFSGCEDEPVRAKNANVEYTRAVCRRASELGAKLCYISTDLVYDGASEVPPGGFSERESPTPRSCYSTTKFLGEKIVSELPKDSWVVLRTALLYGAPRGAGGGPLRWLIRSLKERVSVPVFFDEWRTPFWVGDLIQVIEKSFTLSVSGVFHCAGDERVNRVHFAELLGEVMGLPVECGVVSRLTVPGPPRAEDVSLLNLKMKDHFNIEPVSLREGFERSIVDS